MNVQESRVEFTKQPAQMRDELEVCYLPLLFANGEVSSLAAGRDGMIAQLLFPAALFAAASSFVRMAK
jgi:hypothetical protein